MLLYHEINIVDLTNVHVNKDYIFHGFLSAQQHQVKYH
jgi:hypothetical protein